MAGAALHAMALCLSGAITCVRSADDHVWSAFVRKEQDPLYTTEPLSKERLLFRFPLSSAGGAKPPPESRLLGCRYRMLQGLCSTRYPAVPQQHSSLRSPERPAQGEMITSETKLRCKSSGRTCAVPLSLVNLYSSVLTACN